jgi:cysteine-S-conjugate beta-lyase
VNWRSKLVQAESKAPQSFRALVQPTHRGSTVVFGSQAEASEDWRIDEHEYTYGLHGTPTTLELARRIAELEGAQHTFITPGGQAAIALIYLSFCSSGSHVLLPTTAYGPNKELGEGLLRRCGIQMERYDPLIGAGIKNLIRPETSLIWCESPGSITMEVQDVPAIVEAAHAKGVPVALDNTYSAGIMFDAFSFGVDVSMQAVTKYVGGHSDLLLGSVSARGEEVYKSLGECHKQLGMAASPDDCSLALRGLQTLAVRLDALERSTLTIARWLAEQQEVKTVLHPALRSCPGHENWSRDFKGSTSIFSIVFADQFDVEQINGFVDALRLFKIGFSWGGVTSLVMAYPTLDHSNTNYAGRIVRFNIGFEDADDLKEDLAIAFASLRASLLNTVHE